MPTAHEEFGDFVQWEIFPYKLNHLACLGNLQAKEFITLAIFARTSLEEAHQDASLGIVAQRFHMVDNFFGCHY